MNLRDYAHTETTAFVDRLIAAAEAAAADARATADEQAGALREEAEAVRQENASLHRQVEALRAEGTALRAEFEADAAAAAQALASALETEAGRLTQIRSEHEEAVRQLEAAHADAVEPLRVELEALRASVLAGQARAGALEVRLLEADAAADAARDQLREANALTDAVQEGMSVMRARTRHVTSMLAGSVNAIGALSAAPTVADLFSTLVQQLAGEFPRVALFRRKGHQFHGEQSAGLDGAADITRLVIPASLDSLITRAAATTFLRATAEQLADTRPPFGGTPAYAIAARLAYQDETLAVLYAETDDDATAEARAAFAEILVSLANVLLSRLTQELKTARELREYAQMLLHEAEQMFLADSEEGRPAPDRLRRLHGTIEFGRQLYAQRAALEGTAAAGLLEDEIIARIEAEAPTSFGRALAAALTEMAAQ